jgi:hypothetical protein
MSIKRERRDHTFPRLKGVAVLGGKEIQPSRLTESCEYISPSLPEPLSWLGHVEDDE